MSDSKLVSMESLLEETGAGTSSDLDLSTTSQVPFDEELDSPIIGQQYLAKFHPLEGYEDTLEERESSVVSGVHFNTQREMQVYLDDGYEKISVDEQNQLVNGKVRKIDTKELVERPEVVISLKTKKDALLTKINAYTEASIVGGFEYTVLAGEYTGPYYFDSTKEDQLTFGTMYSATKSDKFETTEPYNGFIPMRGRKITVMEDGKKHVAADKVICQLNETDMQYFTDALALHIGTCKQVGWYLQNQCEQATEETWDTVEAQITAKIEAPNPDYVFEEESVSTNVTE